VFAIVCAAVEISPSELIIAAKATYPSEVPKRCKAFGSATRRQGRRMLQSGRKDSPFGLKSGCLHTAMVIMTPPTKNAIALAIPAPMTPSPAPGIQNSKEKTDIVLVG